MASESPVAIFLALGVNALIAAAKFGAAIFTGSGSMLAEAIHSLADCMNQLLLLFGMRQAREPISELHPLGNGRVSYFYSMIVALLLFFIGGAFSVYEGVHRLLHREPLSYPYVAIAVLVLSLILEAVSLTGAIKQIRHSNGSMPLWRWFRETRESELLVVAGEDSAALAGLSVALIAIVASTVTGNPVYDACGSIGVGLLLMIVAALVLREVKSMIVGESASPDTRRGIHAFLEEREEVRRVINLITLQWGEHIVVAVQAELIDYASGRAQVDAINRIEADLQARFPEARWVFFEPDVSRH
ncbi:cation diffusion facilitator family transporter [Robbsia sp. Bb-Pol-6]|uniref:Cation diffusion facilitator family transporter n=1 Tax=Robbsia betulipollinis TaxID=2981849 RepID=A0ABT3ZN84_9BURK|nr:cation diffusion facilitator family transporter [Robbsia betulipollinis]MCY0388013.1 cation diffusion facilitator family transporter [Robbsia betulipollinis]